MMTFSVAGENSDLYIQGSNYHVQTEDWGTKEAVLVSRIFKNGSVLKTFKLPYAKIKDVQMASQRKKALGQLHNLVIERLQLGQI